MTKKSRIISFVFLLVLVFSVDAYCYWVWSPETGKWVNPVYQTFETPEEQFDWAKGYFDEGDYAKAMSEFRKVVKKFPRSEQAAEASFYIAECLEKLKKHYHAFRAYQTVIDIYPLNERLEETVERQYLLGEIFFSKKKYDKAKEIFVKVISNAPYSKVSDVAQYKIGQCAFNLEDYSDAKSEFEKLIEDYAFSPYLDDATYGIGLCAYKVSANVKNYDESLVDKAIDDLEYFLRRFETSEFVPEAEKLLLELKNEKAEKLFMVGAFYEKHHKNSAALKYYENLIYTYGDTDWAKKAKIRLEKIRKKNS